MNIMSDQNPVIPSPGQEQLLTGDTSPVKRLIAGLVLITVLVGSLGLLQLTNTRKQAMQLAETTCRMLAGTLQQTIGAMLQKTDLTVLHVADEAVHQSATGGLQPKILRMFIERQFKLMPELESLGVADANGNLAYGSGHALDMPVSIADRNFFIELRDHSDDGMVISRPVVSKISNKWVITCARRITLPDGTFGGVAYAELPLQQFSSLFKNVPVGVSGVVSFHRDDLTLITRYSATHDVKNEQATGSALVSEAWRTLLNQGATQVGSFTSKSLIDGILRINAYSRISPYPLYINVGLALDDVLTEARQELFIVVSFIVLFLCMSILLAWQSYRNWQKTFAAEKELKRNYGRLELMQEVSQYHAKNVQDLLDFTLDKVVALTESSAGYIYHYNEENELFVLNTWSKDIMAACGVAEPQSSCQLEKTGLWGEVVRQRRSIMVNDYPASSELKKGYPEGHVHLSRFMNIPVFDNDKIVAVVGVANKTLPYDQSDLLQLTLMMEGLWKIATRLKLEEQIMRAGREWQSTFDAISDSIALIDPDQRVMRCNKATCTVLGREFADIINQPCWKLFHGADAPIQDCPMVKAMLSLHSETTTVQHNGRWLEVTVDPLLSDQGEFVNAVHIVRDVSELKRIESKLMEEKALYKDLIDTQPAGMYRLRVSPMTPRNAADWRVTVNSNYSVDMVTDRFCEILGIDPQSLKDNPGLVADMVYPEDRAGFEEKNFQALAGIDVFKWEGRFGNDQNFVWVRFESVPRKLSTGDIIWTGVVTDITDSKQAEQSLRDMQTQLLHNDKLATVGQLAAGVAHEINNPMGYITSNLTSLGKYADRLDEYIAALQQSIAACSGHPGSVELDAIRKKLKVAYIISDMRELIGESLDGANRVRRIVQDLKSFSRVDQTDRCRTNLNDALETTINIAWNELKYIAALERNFGDIPEIFCYPQQLNQVFLNLLVNAAQAMNKQGQIIVRTWSDSGNVFVSVADTGTGMPEEVQKRIFEPFYTTKAPGKGTGLGLSISADIVRKHGGEIMVASQLGEGTVFTVRLPIDSGTVEEIQQIH